MNARKIMIADGDITFSERLETYLQAQGYFVRTRETGPKALALMKDEWFDLLVLSLSLQGEMDGFSLLKEIKKDPELSRIPVLVSANKPGMRELMKDMGIEIFLEKPFKPDVIVEKIGGLLDAGKHQDFDKI